MTIKMRIADRVIVGALLLLSTASIVPCNSQLALIRASKDGSRTKLAKCTRNVTTSQTSDPLNRPPPKCIALSYPFSCLDIKLPYSSTTIPEYLPDLNIRTIEEIQNYLQRWQGARKLPKCWPLLQVALCSLLMPQCEEDFPTGRAVRVHRPNVDICTDLLARNECGFIARQTDWPALFNCSDTNLYEKNCTSELRDLKINPKLPPVCQYPLVPSSNDNGTWFKDVGGCALHCKFPLTNQDEQNYLNVLIKAACFFGLSFTLFAIALFSANKTNSKMSRMAKVIRHCNKCQFLFYLGWSLQFLWNSDIACSSSGSTLHDLPLWDVNACVLSFGATYLSSLASLFWCAHLGKLCHHKLAGIQKKSPNNSDLDKKMSMLNYGLPLALLVLIAFSGHVDGRGIYGICTVGERSSWTKPVFVFIPLVAGTVYGNFYFFRIIYKLILVRSEKPSLRRNFMRISALAFLTILQVVLTLGNYFYEQSNRERWRDSLDRFVACNLNLNNDPDDRPECAIDAKPIVQLYYLEVLATLAIGLIIASWACCESNFRGLRRKLIDLLEDEKEKQRRARNIRLNYPESVFPNGRVMSEAQDVEETYHDMIDMTSPTRMNDDKTVEMDNVNGGNKKNIDTGTPPSLASTYLSSTLNNDNSSVNTYMPQRNKIGAFRSARDVVNECRQKQAEFMLADNAVQPFNLDEKRRLIAERLMQLNPPDLTECPPDKRENFYHGIVLEDIYSNENE